MSSLAHSGNSRACNAPGAAVCCVSRHQWQSPHRGGGAPRAGLESYPRHVGARPCLVLPGTPAPPRSLVPVTASVLRMRHPPAQPGPPGHRGPMPVLFPVPWRAWSRPESRAHVTHPAPSNNPCILAWVLIRRSSQTKHFISWSQKYMMLVWLAVKQSWSCLHTEHFRRGGNLRHCLYKVISGGDFSAKSDLRGHVNLASCNHCKALCGSNWTILPVMIPWNKISCELW